MDRYLRKVRRAAHLAQMAKPRQTSQSVWTVQLEKPAGLEENATIAGTGSTLLLEVPANPVRPDGFPTPSEAAIAASVLLVPPLLNLHPLAMCAGGVLMLQRAAQAASSAREAPRLVQTNQPAIRALLASMPQTTTVGNPACRAGKAMRRQAVRSA